MKRVQASSIVSNIKLQDQSTIAASDLKNKHLDSASSSLKKRDSLSSLSSGKASIQLSSKPAALLAADDNDHDSDTMPTRTVSSSTAPLTPGNQTPRTSDENKLNGPNTMSDYDIIADIIANATAAASSKSGSYSSLSSGKASIATTPTIASDPMMTSSHSSTTTSTATAAPRKSGLNTFFSASVNRSKSETTMSSASIISTEKPRPTSRSSLLFNTGSLFGAKKKPETEEERELKDAGVTVKEIKGTLGKLVVPQEIANPMPKVKLEAPQHARLNR